MRFLAGWARLTAWCVVLVAFAILGAQGLQKRRIDYESIRVVHTPFASDDHYLSQFNLSSALLDQALADVPADEPMLFVRRYDALMFQEFSILSYTTWPRRLYAVGCSETGQPDYIDFAPRTDPITVAIVAGDQPPAGSDQDMVRQIAQTTWLIRASPGRPWASFCR